MDIKGRLSSIEGLSLQDFPFRLTLVMIDSHRVFTFRSYDNGEVLIFPNTKYFSSTKPFILSDMVELIGLINVKKGEIANDLATSV